MRNHATYNICQHSILLVDYTSICFLPLQNGIVDNFNPFVIELSINAPPRNVDPGNGNETPEDLSEFPVVSLVGAAPQVQVSV